MWSWRFSAAVALGFFVAAVLGLFGINSSLSRAAVTVNMAVCATYAFQAGARLIDRGVSDRTKWVVGVPRRHVGPPS